MKPFIRKYFLLFICTPCLLACSDFLDERTDLSLLIPESVQDLQALLDNSNEINSGMYPGLLEIGTDDYLVPDQEFAALTQFEKDNYVWLDEPLYLKTNMNQNWKNSFIPVLIANTVLDELDVLDLQNRAAADELRGQALFLRAYSYFLFAQVYCEVYRSGEANDGLGLPLRLTADYNQVSVRSTVSQTYQQIIKDLMAATQLLPDIAEYKTRASKHTAHAALARVFLSMQDYQNALKHAEMALAIDGRLIHFKDVDARSPNPFEAMNEETVFFCYSNGLRIFNPTRSDVHPELIAMYDDSDLRKEVYFQSKGGNRYGFKGNFVGTNGNIFFSGLTTSELYLIKAECLARQKRLQETLQTLDFLLKRRYDPAHYTPYTTTDEAECLRIILEERRKELVFRGLRWSDLKRLNLDPAYARTLTRTVTVSGETTTYTLPPNDKRYAYLLPQEVIELTGMKQNPR